MLGYQPEHLSEAFLHQVLVLVPGIAGAQYALAHRIIGIVGFHPQFRILQLAGQIHVIHGYLAQRVFSGMAVHVRHALVHEGAPAQLTLIPDKPVLRLIQDVSDGTVAQTLRIPILVTEIFRVEQLSSLNIINIKLAAYEGVIQILHLGVERLVRKALQADDQLLRLHVNLSGVLVAELATDQYAVAASLILIHLLSESQCRFG